MNNTNHKIKAFWGTGLIASKYIGYNGVDNIDFFIDNNIKNCGKLFFGKPVYHPSEIDNWKNLFVMVPYNFFDEISKQLIEKGLVESKDFTFYDIPKIKKEIDISEKFSDFIFSINNNLNQVYNKIAIFGVLVAHDKGICNFLNNWNKQISDNQFILFSEANWISYEQTKSKLDFPVYVLPAFFDWKVYPIEQEGNMCYDAEKKIILENNFLTHVAITYRKQCNAMIQDYEYYYIYHLEKYYRKLIKLTQPQRVVMWVSFGITHRILRYVCDSLDVSVGYIHPGTISGTFNLDINGEVGESYPALYPYAFRELYVDKEEYVLAQRTLEHLFITKANRKIQPQNDAIKKIENRIIYGKPIVFYAGQNDFESGMQFSEIKRERYYSPIFETSDEAVYFLAEVCKKNNWNFIYKPHPMMDFYVKLNEQLPENIIYIDKADINKIVDLADVTVTILSETAYVALIRKKPLVMLGYNQLRGKGCSYEAFCKEDIENEIKNALEFGHSKEQRDNFILHTAQLLKYYLFDDLVQDSFHYGRKLPVLWEEIEDFAEELRQREKELEIRKKYSIED